MTNMDGSLELVMGIALVYVTEETSHNHHHHHHNHHRALRSVLAVAAWWPQ
jgi:hypothetical protein